MSKNSRDPINELVVLQHPGWLDAGVFWSEYYASEEYKAEAAKSRNEARFFREECYDYRKPQLLQESRRIERRDSIDWIRFRREMFKRYGELIQKVKNNPNAFLVINAWPLDVQMKRAIVSGDRNRIKREPFADTNRLVAFAKEQLGDRVSVFSQQVELEETIVRKNLAAMRARGFKLDEKKVLIRGTGERSDDCVEELCNAFRKAIPQSVLMIDKYYCGDTLKGVKARRIRRHSQMNYAKAKRTEKHNARKQSKHRVRG